MTKFVLNHKFPVIDRDEFLTPFDRLFDQLIHTQFPQDEMWPTGRKYPQNERRRPSPTGIVVVLDVVVLVGCFAEGYKHS